jgi:hypothetical protein
LFRPLLRSIGVVWALLLVLPSENSYAQGQREKCYEREYVAQVGIDIDQFYGKSRQLEIVPTTLWNAVRNAFAACSSRDRIPAGKRARLPLRASSPALRTAGS